MDEVFSPINSLLIDKILDWTKLKACADNDLSLAQMTKFVLDRV